MSKDRESEQGGISAESGIFNLNYLFLPKEWLSLQRIRIKS
jgi:hypothetical protein